MLSIQLKCCKTLMFVKTIRHPSCRKEHVTSPKNVCVGGHLCKTVFQFSISLILEVYLYTDQAVVYPCFSPPLTQYFLECSSFAKETKNSAVSRNYSLLIDELWSRKRYSVNSLLLVDNVCTVEYRKLKSSSWDDKKFELSKSFKCELLLVY